MSSPRASHDTNENRVRAGDGLVEEYDEAIEFYPETLEFDVVYDEELDDGTRLVHVGNRDQAPVGRWLLTAVGNERVGDQTGGYPTLVLYTDDCRGAHEELGDEGVTVTRGPVEAADDVHLHFEDPYGNEIVLVERTDATG